MSQKADMERLKAIYEGHLAKEDQRLMLFSAVLALQDIAQELERLNNNIETTNGKKH